MRRFGARFPRDLPFGSKTRQIKAHDSLLGVARHVDSPVGMLMPRVFSTLRACLGSSLPERIFAFCLSGCSMAAGPRYYRMMRDKKHVGFQLRPSGETHLGREIEEILERYRRPGQLGRANAVYLAETPEFASLGLQYDEGFIHVVEADGEVQRRDQAWLRELQFRHPTNQELAQRLARSIKAIRQEFEALSDQELCESYFSGRLSLNPVVEVLAPIGIVVGHRTAGPTRVRRRGLLSLLK